jgi:hypothetical protein
MSDFFVGDDLGGGSCGLKVSVRGIRTLVDNSDRACDDALYRRVRSQLDVKPIIVQVQATTRILFFTGFFQKPHDLIFSKRKLPLYCQAFIPFLCKISLQFDVEQCSTRHCD